MGVQSGRLDVTIQLSTLTLSRKVDWMLLYNSRLWLFLGKLKSKWLGPFRVIRVLTNGFVKVEGQEGPTFKVNAQRLKLHFGECQKISLIELVYLEMLYDIK